MQPIVSIILPTYNGARTISRAIKSVLAQDYSAWELIIIDDGSTDTTLRVAGEYTVQDARIRVLPNPENVGIQKTLNRGLREARGEYIARIDDDDAWIDAGKLSAQVAYLVEHPECVLVGTGAVVVDEQENEIYRYLLPETDRAIRNSILSKNPFAHPTVLYRAQVAHDVGGYDERVDARHIEDYEFWLRLGQKGTFANLPRYSVMLTARAGSLSARNRVEQFKKSSSLISQYKKIYPRYMQGWVLSRVRLVFYKMFVFLPKIIQRFFLLFYKKM